MLGLFQKEHLPSLAIGAAAAAGIFSLGYFVGRCQIKNTKSNSETLAVAKSFDAGSDPVLKYCLDHSTPLHQVQLKLMEQTLRRKDFAMLGAPEVISLNAALIRALGAKKVIDVGVFTGASSLAAALALPQEGVVLACDVSEEFTAEAKVKWIEAGVEAKIDLRIAPAAETLQNQLDEGMAGQFDFAFIDADKTGYDTYYELCLQLLRPGGIIAFDNTLRRGRVLLPDDQCDKLALAIKKLNDKLAKDSARSFVVQLNVGDGYTLAVKK